DATDGARLTAKWSWAPALIAENRVRDLAERWFQVLETLVRHAARPEAGGLSPSDVPLAALSQAEIERLEQKHRHIEDILPLAPLQQGLVFHALYDADGPDTYTVQLELLLDGELDAAALEAATRALVTRHANLRASFEHESLGRPVQIIVPNVVPRWRVVDLSRLSAEEREDPIAPILPPPPPSPF